MIKITVNAILLTKGQKHMISHTKYFVTQSQAFKDGIIISESTVMSLGKNACISNNVNFGARKGDKEIPKIGNNIIGLGAVFFGDIFIADNCFIGANAVVTKSVLELYPVVIVHQ